MKTFSMLLFKPLSLKVVIHETWILDLDTRAVTGSVWAFLLKRPNRTGYSVLSVLGTDTEPVQSG